MSTVSQLYCFIVRIMQMIEEIKITIKGDFFQLGLVWKKPSYATLFPGLKITHHLTDGAVTLRSFPPLHWTFWILSFLLAASGHIRRLTEQWKYRLEYLDAFSNLIPGIF